MIEYPIYIQKVPKMPRYFWHPSVVYIPEGFGGHQWWMAQTPFHPLIKLEPYQDRWELPCIHYSDDGIHWKSVEANPIDDLSEAQIEEHAFMSDPHLVYKNGELECWYRITYQINKQIEGNKIVLFRKKSTDGTHWSEREVMADLRNESESAEWVQIVSPAIVWTGKQYECYYVDGSHYIEDRHICVRTSIDGEHWTNAKQCKLKGYEDVPWHIDVQLIDGKYHLICYGDPHKSIVHMTSSDGIEWSGLHELLQVSSKRFSFYSERLYRACLVKREDIFNIYFSGANRLYSYIGLMQTRDWKIFTITGASWNTQYFRDQLVLFMDKTFRNICKGIRLE